MQCSGCGRALPETVRFCFSCGSPLAEENKIEATSAKASPRDEEAPGEAAVQMPAREIGQDEALPPEADFVFQEFNGPSVSVSASARPNQPSLDGHGGIPPAGFLPHQGQPLPGTPVGVPGYPGGVPYPYQRVPVAPGMVPVPFQPTAAPARKRRGRSTGWIVLYAFLAVAVLFTGLGIAVYGIGLQALSNVNAKNQAIKTAAMQLYRQVSGQPPTLKDLFDSASINHWNLYQQPTYGCSEDSGGLLASISDKGFFSHCGYEGVDMADLAFQTQMQILSGDAGGLIFRVTPAADGSTEGFYFFEVDRSGRYTISALLDTGKGTFKHTMSGITSAMNKQLQQTNTLTLIAQKDTFDLFLNGQFVVQLQDSTFSGGFVGVLASDRTAPTNVLFTNAEIWVL